MRFIVLYFLILNCSCFTQTLVDLYIPNSNNKVKENGIITNGSKFYPTKELEILITSPLILIDSIELCFGNREITEQYLNKKSDTSFIYTVCFSFGTLKDELVFVLCDDELYIRSYNYILNKKISENNNELPSKDTLKQIMEKECLKIKSIKFKEVSLGRNDENNGTYYDGLLEKNVAFDLNLKVYEHSLNGVIRMEKKYDFQTLDSVKMIDLNLYDLFIAFEGQDCSKPFEIQRSRSVLIDANNLDVKSDGLTSEISSWTNCFMEGAK